MDKYETAALLISKIADDLNFSSCARTIGKNVLERFKQSELPKNRIFWRRSIKKAFELGLVVPWGSFVIKVDTSQLTEINNLLEIKQNGFYKLNGNIVLADNFGDDFFSKNCLLPPVLMNGEKQFFADKSGDIFQRDKIGTGWGKWYK
jgi:hypothetical protein